MPAVPSGPKTGRQRAFCPGKPGRHGRNAPAVCSRPGGPPRAAAPRPGATAEVTAARRAGIAAILTSVIGVLAGLGYPGWDEAVITGRRTPRGKDLTSAQRAANRLQAQLRCVGERVHQLPCDQTPLGPRDRIIADYTARRVSRTVAPLVPHEHPDL